MSYKLLYTPANIESYAKTKGAINVIKECLKHLKSRRLRSQVVQNLTTFTLETMAKEMHRQVSFYTEDSNDLNNKIQATPSAPASKFPAGALRPPKFETTGEVLDLDTCSNWHLEVSFLTDAAAKNYTLRCVIQNI